MSSTQWYLIASPQGHPHPVALIADKHEAEQFLREHYPHGSLEKVDISQCVVRPVVEMINEHHPILLGAKNA